MSLFAELQRALDGRVEQGVPLAGRTSVRVGGAAELFAQPQTEDALARLLEVCQQRGVAYHLLGGGCNTLLSDEGVRGVVVRLAPAMVAEAQALEGGRPTFTLGAGQPIARLVSLAREKRCVGAEFLAGIPGTLGGAVTMNAGTKAGAVEQVCVAVGVCEPGRRRALSGAEAGFVYRGNRLPPGAVVTWARFALREGSPEELAAAKAAMDEDLARRKSTQPLSLPNFGSVFRNPPGDSAGRLIEACGLKGLREGGAQISEVHANFIVNRGEARAREVLALMRRMQAAVEERFGVLLVPEVRLLGEFEAEAVPRGVERAA